MPGRRSESGRFGDEPVDDRLLVPGFDALDFRFLDAFADSLPHVESLRRSGVETVLRTTFRPITGSAWPSMYTGVDPSRHGVFGFFTYEDYPDDGRLIIRNDVRVPALRNYLSAMGVPAVVLNVPAIYPGEPISGAMIPGYLAPEDAAGHPASVRTEVSDETGEYPVYPDESRPIPERYVELIDLRRRASEFLLAERGWRLAVIQVRSADTVFHGIDDPAAHRRVYEAADEFLGSMLDVVGVAQVAMSVLGAPVPERMTGAVPPGLPGRSSERRAYGDVGFGRSAAADDGNGVEDRLRELGYV